MPYSRTQIEKHERQSLAPFAQLSSNSRGRKYNEIPHEWRTDFQRDRDRIIHSRAFRRLEYKTQVFLNGSGDHLRTRLTHTMEVAAISRNIARALGLNEDLAEAIALAHDLGHSPFGHKGEHSLNNLMKDHGGFEHNRQSLRIVETLEQKYPHHDGLNLTWETREGLAKHYTSYDHPSKREDFVAKSSSLEAQVANLADEITYYSHDLDDGLASELLDEEDLKKNVQIWGETADQINKEHGELDPEPRLYAIIRLLINSQVHDVVETSNRLITEAEVQSADEVRLHDGPLIQYSDKRRAANLELREYLYENLYYNP
ncbi:MAG: deoxyguanosinetriphosphate triphosphohydrolase, partial [Verrucomicrobiota bacterium]|nr:deoxyguanosinetriphosphate triphosphohydrolase [Verrucomicrobiota bacterium]